MPGHAGSPFWATVDFDSDGDEDPGSSPSNRIYLDPWDNEAYATSVPDPPDSIQEENFNSFAGEPVSASFYYVPTKTYDEEEAPIKRIPTPPQNVIHPDYVYARKHSRGMLPEIHADVPIYNCDRVMRDRRRSIYNVEEAIYTRPPPMMYEPLYGPIVPPPPMGYVPPPPRSRMSLPHHADYVMSHYGYARPRRYSRLTDAHEHMTYESLSPEYEDWARPFPKAAPDNFHLSRYGHLQIDYSFSWNSLDRLIRNH